MTGYRSDNRVERSHPFRPSTTRLARLDSVYATLLSRRRPLSSGHLESSSRILLLPIRESRSGCGAYRKKSEVIRWKHGRLSAGGRTRHPVRSADLLIVGLRIHLSTLCLHLANVITLDELVKYARCLLLHFVYNTRASLIDIGEILTSKRDFTDL